jgi:hypothetical protein
MKIFVLYRLKDGVWFDEYRRWSLNADKPTLRAIEEISQFTSLCVLHGEEITE